MAETVFWFSIIFEYGGEGRFTYVNAVFSSKEKAASEYAKLALPLLAYEKDVERGKARSGITLLVESEYTAYQNGNFIGLEFFDIVPEPKDTFFEIYVDDVDSVTKTTFLIKSRKVFLTKIESASLSFDSLNIRKGSSPFYYEAPLLIINPRKIPYYLISTGANENTKAVKEAYNKIVRETEKRNRLPKVVFFDDMLTTQELSPSTIQALVEQNSPIPTDIAHQSFEKGIPPYVYIGRNDGLVVYIEAREEEKEEDA